jgi:hypothetical protein
VGACDAAVVDDIPSVNQMYVPNGGTVADVYTKMVKGVQNHEPPPSPELEARRRELKKVLLEQGTDEEGRTIERPTALADAEQKAHAAYQDAYMTYLAKFAAAQADEELKRIWPIVGAQALQLPKRAFADWGAAGRDQIESAKAQLATRSSGSTRSSSSTRSRRRSFGRASRRRIGRLPTPRHGPRTRSRSRPSPASSRRRRARSAAERRSSSGSGASAAGSRIPTVVRRCRRTRRTSA